MTDPENYYAKQSSIDKANQGVINQVYHLNKECGILSAVRPGKINSPIIELYKDVDVLRKMRACSRCCKDYTGPYTGPVVKRGDLVAEQVITQLKAEIEKMKKEQLEWLAVAAQQETKYKQTVTGWELYQAIKKSVKHQATLKLDNDTALGVKLRFLIEIKEQFINLNSNKRKGE